MYTLRKISSKGIEINHSLGDNYTVVHRERNSNEFDRNFEIVFNKPRIDPDIDKDGKRVYAFVLAREGAFIQPLYESQRAYIMCSDGKTLDNLTWK